MADVIVSSVHIRLRHPVHEAGMTNVFDATTQEWITDSDGKVVAMPEKGPFTPQQLDDKGLTMPVIVNQALQTAMRDRVAALETAAGLTAERDAAQADRARAEADRALAVKVRDEALVARDAALAELAACRAEHGETVEGLKAEIADLSAADDGPANPVLNFLSFGKLGN